MGRSSSASNTTQNVTNTQDIDTETVTSEGSGNLVLNADGAISFRTETTDLGAVDNAFDFADAIGTRALSFGQSAIDQVAASQESTQKTLASAITKVADATRSDSSETLRRLGLYAAIAVAVIFVAMQFKK